ncbi:MAG TPA: RND transporter, partial [Variovorax sp.]
MDSRLHSPGPSWRGGLLPLLAALVLAGCASAPKVQPEFTPPAQFKEQAAAGQEGSWTPAQPAESQPRGEWWRAFDDPQLDQLIASADQRNSTLQGAAARLADARALAHLSDADRAPQVGLGVGAV